MTPPRRIEVSADVFDARCAEPRHLFEHRADVAAATAALVGDGESVRLVTQTLRPKFGLAEYRARITGKSSPGSQISSSRFAMPATTDLGVPGVAQCARCRLDLGFSAVYEEQLRRVENLGLLRVVTTSPSVASGSVRTSVSGSISLRPIQVGEPAHEHLVHRVRM